MAGVTQDAAQGTATLHQADPEGGAVPAPELLRGPLPATLCEPFEAHTRAAPDAPAVLLGDRQVSYAELNAMANRLAHRLLDMRVGPERVVAVCAERSPETLAAILCVLKAGGTLLPLDPSDPQERLQALIADARPRVVLADSRNRARFATEETLWVDAVARSPEDSDPPGQAGPRTAACMFYTSGSTGSPKGVVVEHRGLLNLLTWTDRCLLGERELRLPVISRLTLAPAFKQLFVPWLRGEPVWLLDERVASDPVELLRALSGDQRVALNCVPHLWEAMLEAAAAGRARLPDTLRLLCLQGESPTQALVDRSFAALGELELCNIYGATEVGIASVARIRPGDAVSLGSPIAGVEAHILDDELAPVAAGEPGELHIGGVGLARGYVSRPALTAERFIPDPFNSRPAARLFKTADIVRRSAAGELEFVGRRDGLMKVRGFRIEPSEVEDAVGRHPGVARCAVVSTADERHGDRLVACVVAGGGGAPTPAQLRAFLASKLPIYMVPTRVLVLDTLPTMPSGKTDRRALAHLAGSHHGRRNVDTRVARAPTVRGLPGRMWGQLCNRMIFWAFVLLRSLAAKWLANTDWGPIAAPPPARRAHGYTAPGSALEHELQEIWERLLDVRPVGIDDDFFDLGGDSLMAVSLLTEVARHLRVDMPPAVLLHAPTVRGLARTIEDGAGFAWRTVVPLQAAGSRRPFFFVPPSSGYLGGFAVLARRLGPDRPCYGLQPQGLDGESAPHTRVEDMAAHYLEGIRSVQDSGPYLLAGRCFGGSVAFEMARQLEAAGEEVALLAIIDGPAHRSERSALFNLALERGLEYRGEADPPASATARSVVTSRARRVGATAVTALERLLGLPLVPGPARRAPKRIRRWRKRVLRRPTRWLRRRTRWIRRPTRRLVKRTRKLVKSGPLMFRLRLHGELRWMSRSSSPARRRTLRRVELAGDEAHRVYRGGSYTGTVVLFLTEFFLASGLDRGWSRIADVEIEPVSGNHVTLALEPHVRVLAERLNARAEAAEVRHRMRETSNA